MNNKTALLKTSLSDQVYETLLNRLVRLEIKLGERINLDDLKEEFSVSIAPIREALQRLSQENLVVIKPHIGFFANTLSINDVDNLFKARKVLELFAISIVINTIAEDELLAIRNNMLQISKEKKVKSVFSEQNNCDDFENLDIAFHSCILISNCGNTYIKKFYNSLNNLTAIIRHIAQRFDDDYKEHIAIIDAMLEKDIKKSETALCRHIENAEKATIEALRQKSYLSE